MNQAAAKAERRSIRKAFGPEAVELLQRQTEATNFCTATVSAVSERIEGCGARVNRVEQRLDALANSVAELEEINGRAHRDLFNGSGCLRRSFLGRVKWLVTGR